MHVIAEKRIWEAIDRWPRAARALDAWYRLIKALAPRDYAELKGVFPALDKVGEFHVFDIGGNKIRLIAVVLYPGQRLYIKHILDHTEYSRGKWKEVSR
jgi:mRNA interferase HigB